MVGLVFLSVQALRCQTQWHGFILSQDEVDGINVGERQMVVSASGQNIRTRRIGQRNRDADTGRDRVSPSRQSQRLIALLNEEEGRG